MRKLFPMFVLLIAVGSLDAKASVVLAEVGTMADWKISTSTEDKEMVVYVAGRCSVTVLRNGDVIAFAAKDEVKQFILIQKETRKFWVSPKGIVESGPNLMIECPIDALPLGKGVKDKLKNANKK